MLFSTGAMQKTLFKLEPYEVISLCAVILLSVVFVAARQQLAVVFGLTGPSSSLLVNLAVIANAPWTWVFISCFTLLLTIYLTCRQSRIRQLGQLAQLSRYMATFLVVMLIYKAVIFYIAVFNPFDRDFALQHIDDQLFFGRMPSEWLSAIICPACNWFFGLCYLSWFFFVYFTVVLLLSRSEDAAREYVFTAVLTFLIGYLVYLFVPAIGPMFTAHFQNSAGPIPRLLVMGQSVIARDCFPSLHTGLSTVMAVTVWRHHRRFAWLYLPLAVCIIFSTLYLRVHYGLDVIAGLSLAGVTTQVAPMMTRAWVLLGRSKKVEIPEVDAHSLLKTSVR